MSCPCRCSRSSPASSALSEAPSAYAPLYVTALVAPNHLAGANGALSRSSSAAALAGPALAAATRDVAPAPIGLIVEAASYLVSLGARHGLTRQLSAPAGPSGLATASAPPAAADHPGRTAGLAAFAHRSTAELLAATSAATLLNGGVLGELAVFMVRQPHLAASVMALVAAAGAAIGGVITGLVAGRLQRRLGNRRPIALGTLAVAVSIAFFPLVHPGVTGTWPVLDYELGGSAGGAICFVVTFTAILAHIPGPQIARAMAAARPEAGRLLAERELSAR